MEKLYKSCLLIISSSLFLTGCLNPDLVKTTGLDRSNKQGGSSGNGTPGTGTFAAFISGVSVVNNQLIISGGNLDQVGTVKLTGTGAFNESFTIESKTASKLIANSTKNISILMGGIFNLLLSNAYGASTFQVSFSLPNGSVMANQLNQMGANPGQYLKWNGSTWIPSDLSSLTYLGAWSAASGSAPTPGPSSGDYSIVSAPGTFNSITYAIGDWIIFNGTNWDKISNAGAVVSFKGRAGAIVPTAGDYSFSLLADFDATVTPATNHVLIYNGTKWVSQVAPFLPLTGGSLSGSLAMGTNKITGLGNPTLAQDATTKSYVDALFASAGSGDITAVTAGTGLTGGATTGAATLNVDVGTTANKIVQLTAGAKLPAVDGSLLTNLPVQTDASKLPLTGGSLSGSLAMGTNKITGLGNPTLAQDATTKSYVDTQTASRVPTSTTVNGKALTGNITLTKADVGLTNLLDLKDNVAATTAPIATDDSSAGYSVGSRWINTTTNKAYICLLASAGVAVWKEIAYAANSVATNGTSSMTGSLNLNNNKITNLAAPVASTDGANKAYVDAAGVSYTLSSTTANAGMYDNRIPNMTPPAAYTEVCFKAGATQIDAHTISESTTTGVNCNPGDVGYIIEKVERTAQTWELARETCLKNNMRLPEPFEWKLACKNATIAATMTNMINNFEWASNFALSLYNGINYGVGSAIFGSGGCHFAYWGWLGYGTGSESSYTFRCVR